MSTTTGRREFLRVAAVTSAGLALAKRLPAAPAKSVLVFTKSSGFEHEVVKRIDGKPSLMDDTITTLGDENGFHVGVTKDGRIFDEKKFHDYSAEGKQNLLEAIHNGMGFVGIHAAADTFHPQPDPKDLSNRYIAHGEQQDPYLKMLGAEFIIHGSNPRLQDASLIVNDPKFPGLEGVSSPVSLKEEWYSLKDF